MSWVTKRSGETYQPESEQVYTRQQRIRNWWDYHTGWVVFGIIAVLLGGLLIHDMFFRPEPDYRIGYVSTELLPDEVVAGLRESLQQLGADQNGDGRVLVEVTTYDLGFDEQSQLDVDATSAGMTSLTADLMSGGLSILLLTDPEGFQLRMGALGYLDGSTPAMDAPDAEAGNWRQMVYRWEDCPVLAGLNLGTYTQFWDLEETPVDGQTAMQGVYVARKAAWNEEQKAAAAADDALWQAMTAGAVGMEAEENR